MKKIKLKDIFTEPEILSQVILEILYAIITINYLIHLNNFNKLMLANGLTKKLEESSSVMIASEILNEGGASYLTQAVIWVAVGLALFFVFYKIGKTSSYPAIGVIIKIFHIIVFLLFLVILWQLIDNPIVHAFLIVSGVVSIGLASLSK